MSRFAAHTIFLVRISLFSKQFLRRCLSISSRDIQINGEIKDKEVRLIDSNGEQHGVVPIAQACAMAKAQNLDLVKVASKANPPVCKILDYGKYCFEMAKKEKESKKNQRIVDIKEIRLSVNIGTNDLNTKVAHAQRFINNGDKVKVSIRFRGREMGHPEVGYDIMNKFANLCAEFAAVERPAKLDGKNMLMFLSSKPKSGNSTKNTSSEKNNKKGSEEGKDKI